MLRERCLPNSCTTLWTPSQARRGTVAGHKLRISDGPGMKDATTSSRARCRAIAIEIREAAKQERVMLNLIAASAYFLLIHCGVSGTQLRDTVVARLGERPYRGAFALASLFGLVWMGYAYRYAPTIPLWGLLLGFRPAAYVLVLIALIFV